MTYFKRDDNTFVVQLLFLQELNEELFYNIEAYTFFKNSSDIDRKLCLSNTHHSNHSFPVLIGFHIFICCHIKAESHACDVSSKGFCKVTV